MSALKLTISIITPSGTLYEDNNIDMVVAPSITGMIGILPNHIPIFTKLKHGEIKILINKTEKFFTFFRGFLHLDTNNHLTIMADNAKRSEELDLETIRKAKEAAETALKEKDKLSTIEIIKAETAMRRAIMELRVAEKRQFRT